MRTEERPAYDRPSAPLECADDGQLGVPSRDEQLGLPLRLLVGLRDALGACIIVGAGAESPDRRPWTPCIIVLFALIVGCIFGYTH